MPYLTLTGNGLTPTLANSLFIFAFVFLGIAIGYYAGLKKANKANKQIKMNVANALTFLSILVLAAVVLALKYPEH